MSISTHSISRIGLLVPLTIGAVLPLSAEDHGGKARDTMSVVLYEGPLAHDEDWIIKAGRSRWSRESAIPRHLFNDSE